MDLNKRILRAINEGVSAALMLDNTDIPNIIRKSSAQISNDVKMSTEKALYSRKLQEIINIKKPRKKDIKLALDYYEQCGAQFVFPASLDHADFQIFIFKVIEMFGPTVNLNWIDTHNITNLNYMFNSNFNGDVSKWDTSNVVDMCGTFKDCPFFNGDISQWDVSNVKRMFQTFQNCTNFDCDLSYWDISNVDTTNAMFYMCKKFKGKGLENWDMSNVTQMQCMFYGCEKLNCDFSSWNVTNVINAQEAFAKCTSIKDLSHLKFNCTPLHLKDICKGTKLKSKQYPKYK